MEVPAVLNEASDPGPIRFHAVPIRLNGFLIVFLIKNPDAETNMGTKGGVGTKAAVGTKGGVGQRLAWNKGWSKTRAGVG